MNGETADQIVVFAVLGVAFALFVRGPWRYDIVALVALLAVTLTGVVPALEAFSGFGHPAVVTVAAVLVISRGLQIAGVVDLISRPLGRAGNGPAMNVLALTATVAVLSGFMNNVGALALMMPVAIRKAREGGYPPAVLLMPLAFGSLLGGLTTLIGTPPNIIIAGYREAQTGSAFNMFDFAPAGVLVAGVGVAFIAIAGWRLVPRRSGGDGGANLFEIERYLAEVRVPPGSRADGLLIRDLEDFREAGILIVSIVRGTHRVTVPSAFDTIRGGDELCLEAEPAALRSIVERFGLEYTGARDQAAPVAAELSTLEAVILPASPLAGRTAREVFLRTKYGVNLLAVARSHAPPGRGLSDLRLIAGDVVLLQGDPSTWPTTLRALVCAPVQTGPQEIQNPSRLVVAALIFAVAIGATAAGLVAAQVALGGAAVAMVVAGVLRVDDAYQAIDWPVIVLLGAMIPVGAAFESSGNAREVADAITWLSGSLPDEAALVLLLATTVVLSNILNNAAAAVLMAPIGLKLAEDLAVSPDPMLMAVAIGASSPFLTPIGHQSNTLVMGPAGYEFGDYWRLGLPLQVIVIVVAVPALLIIWPL